MRVLSKDSFEICSQRTADPSLQNQNSKNYWYFDICCTHKTLYTNHHENLISCVDSWSHANI